MRKFWIIALDVYKKNVKSISFLLLILMPFLLMGIMYLATSFAGKMNDVNTIGVVSDDQNITANFVTLSNDAQAFESYDSEEGAQAALKEEEIDAYLTITNQAGEISAVLYSSSGLGNTLEASLQQYLASFQTQYRASQLNLTPDEVASLNQPAELTTQKVSFSGDQMEIGKDNSGVQYAISYITTIILFIFIMTYSQIIAQEIASEKGTRIMEVLLSSTKAQIHFHGKIVGILLVALTQLVVYVIAFVVAYFQFKDTAMIQAFIADYSLDSFFGPFLWYTILYILMGIYIYAVLSALSGSLVNKAEDTSKAIQPVIYLSLVGYMIGLIMGAADPNNIVIRVASYIPFVSSYIMPVRLANDTVTNSGVMLSLGILLLSSVALVIFSTKLYKSNVLVYSEGGVWSSLKQSVSIMKNENKKKVV